MANRELGVSNNEIIVNFKEIITNTNKVINTNVLICASTSDHLVIKEPVG